MSLACPKDEHVGSGLSDVNHGLALAWQRRKGVNRREDWKELSYVCWRVKMTMGRLGQGSHRV